MKEHTQEHGQIAPRTLTDILALRDAAWRWPMLTGTQIKRKEAFIDAVKMLEAVRDKAQDCLNCGGTRYEQVDNVDFPGGPPCPYCTPILAILGGESHD